MRRAPRPKPIALMGQSWLDQAHAGHLIDSTGRNINRPLNVADIVDGLVQLKQHASIDKLVVFGLVPPLPFSNLHDRLSRPSLAGRSIDFNLRGYTCNAKSTQLNAAMQKAANATGAFTFIDPSRALQKQGQCVAVNEAGDLLFSNGGHLSKTGSRAVIRRYADELGALLRSG